MSTLEGFSLEPGDLRENVLIDDRAFGGLHQLPSGTVLRLGQVPVRLTFHCEPCGRMKRFVPRPGALAHKRGYLASVVEPGIINEGGAIVSLGQQFEPIPYGVRERVLWYLSKSKTPVPLAQLVSDVGLSASYCRAIPGLLREHPEALSMIARSGRNDSDATLPLPFFTR